MTTRPHLPDDRNTAEAARAWADEVVQLSPTAKAFVVWYAPRRGGGRKLKPSVAKVRRQLLKYAREGDLAAARAAIERLRGLKDPGVIWCGGHDELAAALKEQVRWGDNSWVEQIVSEKLVSITVWRE